MTQFLPPNLLALFAARDPIPYLPPAGKLPHEKKQKGYDGIAAFLHHFEVNIVSCGFLVKHVPTQNCVSVSTKYGAPLDRNTTHSIFN